jgi:hypothetical protein
MYIKNVQNKERKGKNIRKRRKRMDKRERGKNDNWDTKNQTGG